MPAGRLMDSLDFGPDLLEVRPDAPGAIAQTGGNYPVGATAVAAAVHDGYLTFNGARMTRKYLADCKVFIFII
jgi:hypothetical protein